ncbi:hypothetical protein MVEG_11774 [Podila verticillata NRRL 6337]|uniref:Uncharacterized protein n=1 Tax=Podila verticillata NRRL 6337 TaxID=1069443 RepID=A0A086TJK8_9FUNG|nr:hypothetical protein MVEG_11774 [Podila verticillata NRRL 6337]
MDTTPPIFQRFENKNGPLQSLPTHISEEHGDRYVLWSDIQHAFKGVGLWQFIAWGQGLPILFVVDGDTIRKFTEQRSKWDDEQEGRSEESLPFALPWAQTLNDTTGQHIEASQGCTHESPDKECTRTLHFKNLFKSLKILNEELTDETEWRSGCEDEPRDIFQKLAANIRYFYSMILQELERLKALGMQVKVDGMAEEQLCTHIRDMYQETLMAEYRNNCLSSLCNGSLGYDLYYPAPRLFIVLPADLDTWIDSDTATHSFRLFFMCENKKQESETPEDTPQHVHVSNHPGYNLQRPQEFFQIYGDYVLRLLQMVECGYSDNRHVVPALNSFKILCDYDTVVSGSHLSKETIGSLVAKSIAYIQKLSPSKWIEDPTLSANQSAMIKAYLEIPDNCDGQGNLHRHINAHEKEVLWMCQWHNERQLHQEALQELQVFVQSHAGHVRMQEATLRVELCSDEDADQFCTLLMGTKHTFNLSIKINWKSTRSSMAKLCRDVACTGTVILEIDGATLDSQPEGPVQHSCHPFSDVLLGGKFPRFIALLNYPRPHERRLYFKNFSLRMLGSPVHSTFNWVDLLDISRKFEASVCKAQKASGYSTAAREFRSALEHIGLPSATEFTMARTSTAGEAGTQRQIEWAYKFDLQELAFVDAYSNDMQGPISVLCSQSLQRLTVHLEKDLSVRKNLAHVVRINTQLHDLSFSYYGHDILYYIRYIFCLWCATSVSSLTLIDHMRGMQGRTIMQLTRNIGYYLLQSGTVLDSRNADPSVCQQPPQAWGFDILQLDCDHVFSQLLDASSVILASFMKYFPTDLTLLTLDVSHLSREGLLSVETILQLSHLEYLKVICNPVKSHMSIAVARVLRSIQWSTLKSLTIIGAHIETWVSIWMSAHSNPFNPYRTFGGPQLLHLHLHHTGLATPQLLSHASALFVHGLVYLNPSVELVLTNFILKDDFC